MLRSEGCEWRGAGSSKVYYNIPTKFHSFIHHSFVPPFPPSFPLLPLPAKTNTSLLSSLLLPLSSPPPLLSPSSPPPSQLSLATSPSLLQKGDEEEVGEVKIEAN
jgi:hypothetical protein